MKDKLNKPCAGCPWRRESSPGWLGASTAKEFVYRADKQDPMECHMTGPNQEQEPDIDVRKDVMYKALADHFVPLVLAQTRPGDLAGLIQRMRDTQ